MVLFSLVIMEAFKAIVSYPNTAPLQRHSFLGEPTQDAQRDNNTISKLIAVYKQTIMNFMRSSRLLLAVSISFLVNLAISLQPSLGCILGLTALSREEWLLILTYALPVIPLDAILTKFVNLMESSRNGLDKKMNN